MNTYEELKNTMDTYHVRRLTEQIKDIHEQRVFNKQLLKQYELAPEYIPMMIKQRQEELNDTLHTLSMIIKEFEK